MTQQLPSDIVQRITQHIQSFQRSKVQLGEPREVVMPAARVGDIINHTSFWSALAGAVVGACVTAGIFALASAAVAAVGITGGLAAPIAAAVLGGVATWAVSDGIEKVTNAVTNFINEAIGGDPSGPIILGSPNVLVNNKPLALAKLPLSVGCTRHSPPPQIAQASETVSANGKPVARKGDKTECSATIAEGSPNVFFGSGQGTYVDMKPEFTGFQRTLLIGMEFMIPPTMLISKGMGKAVAQAGKSLAMRGAYVGANITTKIKSKFSKKTIHKFLTSKKQLSTDIIKNNKRKTLKNNSRNGKRREIEVKQELINEGYEILGSQVSIKTTLTRRVIDHLVRKNNEIKAIEVKHGKAQRTPMQIKKDDLLEIEGGEFIGKNAPDFLKKEKIKIKTEVRR
ncbi:PAAR domain-containing protein [Avibacterium paragallinarum]|uniref:PAAR domain-containing protein n=2 Tax=Pasteurellales TaxID=135625 RepID=UPI00397A8F04